MEFTNKLTSMAERSHPLYKYWKGKKLQQVQINCHYRLHFIKAFEFR